MRQQGHLGVFGRAEQQLPGTGQISLAQAKPPPAVSHRGHLGVLARKHQELAHVLHDVRAGQQELKLAEAIGVAGELLSKKRFQSGLLR